MRPTVVSLRNIILYRTLLHEVGHRIDYRRSGDEQWEGKTSSVKEDFAHRYASERFATLARLGIVPFAPRFDVDEMVCCGLKPEWFRPRNRQMEVGN